LLALPALTNFALTVPPTADLHTTPQGQCVLIDRREATLIRYTVQLSKGTASQDRVKRFLFITTVL
jgi:hypothetical protein